MKKIWKAVNFIDSFKIHITYEKRIFILFGWSISTPHKELLMHFDIISNLLTIMTTWTDKKIQFAKSWTAHQHKKRSNSANNNIMCSCGPWRLQRRDLRTISVRISYRKWAMARSFLKLHATNVTKLICRNTQKTRFQPSLLTHSPTHHRKQKQTVSIHPCVTYTFCLTQPYINTSTPQNQQWTLPSFICNSHLKRMGCTIDWSERGERVDLVIQQLAYVHVVIPTFEAPEQN